MKNRLAALTVLALGGALVLPIQARAFDETVETYTETYRSPRPLVESVVKEESQETTTTTTTTEAHRARPIHHVVRRIIRRAPRPMVSESIDETVETSSTTINHSVPVFVPPPVTVERSTTYIEREPPSFIP